jgi:hypothetical protein
VSLSLELLGHQRDVITVAGHFPPDQWHRYDTTGEKLIYEVFDHKLLIQILGTFSENLHKISFARDDIAVKTARVAF